MTFFNLSQRILPRLMATTVLTLSGNLVFAANVETEVTYLINYVSESGCIFNRNDKAYQSNRAAEHLAMKYDRVKRRIDTTEVFIDKVASKSSMSGKPYTIECEQGVQQAAGPWLYQALEKYRAAHTIQ